MQAAETAEIGWAVVRRERKCTLYGGCMVEIMEWRVSIAS